MAVLCRVARCGGVCCLPGSSDGFFEDLESVHVVQKDSRPVELICPPPRDAFFGVICWYRDVWGEFLCAGCEEELVVCPSKDAAGVGI